MGSEHVGVYAEQISPTPYDAMTGMAPTLGPMNYATVEIHDDGDDAGLFGFDRDSAMSVHENAERVMLTIVRTEGKGGTAVLRCSTVCSNCIDHSGRHEELLHRALTFADGVTSMVLPIDVYNNYARDGDFHLQVHLSSVTGSGGVARLNPLRQSMNVTIVDDETTAAEGGGAATGTIGFEKYVFNATEDAGYARIGIVRTGTQFAGTSVVVQLHLQSSAWSNSLVGHHYDNTTLTSTLAEVRS